MSCLDATIFFDAGTMRVYEHNYDADTWSLISNISSSGGPGTMERSFAAMISTYGVILVVEGTSTGTPQIWLYKI